MADAEHYEVSDYVRVSPTVPNVGEALPIRRFGYLVPYVQGRAPFAVLGGRLSNSLSAYNPHSQASQFEKFLSSGISIRTHRRTGDAPPDELELVFGRVRRG